MWIESRTDGAIGLGLATILKECGYVPDVAWWRLFSSSSPSAAASVSLLLALLSRGLCSMPSQRKGVWDKTRCGRCVQEKELREMANNIVDFSG